MLSHVATHPETTPGIGPVAADMRAADGTRVLVLLPDLDTLLGTAGFGQTPAAIVLPGTPRLDGWSLFGLRARPLPH